DPGVRSACWPAPAGGATEMSAAATRAVRLIVARGFIRGGLQLRGRCRRVVRAGRIAGLWARRTREHGAGRLGQSPAGARPYSTYPVFLKGGGEMPKRAFAAALVA